MAGEQLPEDIIVKILSKLPVKSLLRFRCVSKRWRSIVSDPQFARLQFKVACEQQTLGRRFLLSSHTTSQFESLDLEPTSFQASSSIRKLDFPIRQGNSVKLLCSCNGLVCVGVDHTESFCIWNPSTGFTYRLPDPRYSSKWRLRYYGFGYVSATDDYKLLLVVLGDLGYVVQMLSLRARNWKKIEADPHHWSPVPQGVLLNEALHWLNWVTCAYAELDSDDEEGEPAIIAFDLAREEFWKMPVPVIAGEHNYSHIVVGVSCDGCLYVICSPHLEVLVSVEFWVMREYGKGDSWTKLFNMRNCNPPKQILSLIPIFVMQSYTVVMMDTLDSGWEVVRIDHHEEKLGETSTVVAKDSVFGNRYGMIGYEESLFWLSDYLGVEDTMVSSKGSKPNTRPHQAEIGEE